MSRQFGLRKVRNRRFLRIAKHTLPSVGFVAVTAAMFVFFLPPISKINNQTPKQNASSPQKQLATLAPEPVKQDPNSATPSSTPAPAPSATSVPETSPPVVKPAPSSNVSHLATTQQSAPSSSGSGQSSSDGSSSSGSPSAPVHNYTSSNWAGYFAADGTYSAVSANWIAPNPSGVSGSDSADATWIGIGGITSGDLIQIGTDNIISSSGQVTTSAFYETLPYTSTPIASITVSPGDSISAALNEVSAGIWTISLTDNTSNQNFTTSVSYNSSLSSVEWIEEDPGNQFDHLYALDNFGNVPFSNCLAGVGGAAKTISALAYSGITMTNVSNQPEAVPSTVGSDGASFNVSWQ